MLLLRSSLVASRHTLKRRALSNSAAAIQSFILPTRHSRNLPPPVCRNPVELQDLTRELLEVKFTPYTPSQEADLWQDNDVVIQKAEYTIRGHAACIPETLWYAENGEHQAPQDHVQAMQGILQQLQLCNENYMTQRRQLRSQVAEYNDDSSSSSDESDSSDSDSDDETFSSITHDAAGPGPTVAMWDTLLDSMAVSLPTTHPSQYKEILSQVLQRHEDDGGAKHNTNPCTVPTILTFNAVLRGIANTSYDSPQQEEEIRDAALETAFGVFDEMRWHADRNSATYGYMLGVVQKFLPPSRSRGNIAHGLWTHAKLHHVASSQVLEALHAAHQPSNGAEFDEWLQQHDDIRKTPLDWRRQHKVLRYNRSSAAY